MLLNKKDQYFQIISEDENKNLFNGCSSFFQTLNSLMISLPNGYAKVFFALLYLAVILSIFFGFLFSFILFILIYNFIYQEKYLLAIVSFINSFSFIINILGCFGKVKCFCLYRPCQWIFFMILFDLIHFVSDIIVFILLIDEHYYSLNGDFWGYVVFGFLGNLGYTIGFLVIHIKIGGKLIILFNYLRTLETDVIKYCVFEYIKELKRNTQLD